MSSSIHDCAWREILKFGEEEKRLAIKAGNLDEDGNVFCTIVADSQ